MKRCGGGVSRGWGRDAGKTFREKLLGEPAFEKHPLEGGAHRRYSSSQAPTGGSSARKAAGAASSLVAVLTTLTSFAPLAACATPELRASPSASAFTFTLLSSYRANRLEEGFPYYPALQGEAAEIPSRFRTEQKGRLLLAHPKLQFELQEHTEISLEQTLIWQGGAYLNRFLTLKRSSQSSPSPLAPHLSLHRGAILVQTAAQPVAIHAGRVSFETSSALFSLSTNHFLGQRLSVTRGEVKVIKSDHSIVFVNAGQTLTTDADPTVRSGGRAAPPPASELPQRLSLLGVTVSPPGEDALPNPQPPDEASQRLALPPEDTFTDAGDAAGLQIRSSANQPASPQ